MKRIVYILALVIGWASAAFANVTTPLTSLRAIHALGNAEASHQLPVAFEATVTYFRWYEKTLFVQDGDVAIFVMATTDAKLHPGDRVLVRGTTRESFRPFVLSDNITLLHHGPTPKPIAANFDQLIHARLDCRLVSLRGLVRSADLVLSSDKRSSSLKLLTPGGTVDVVVDSEDGPALKRLLDGDVEISGAVSGRFDGKMQPTGVLLHVPTLSYVKILKHAVTSPWSLSVTPMDKIIGSTNVRDLSQRVRIQGVITYFHPGEAVVLQSGTKSLWVMTLSRDDIHIGDLVDVIGFPFVHDGFLALEQGEILDSGLHSPIAPVSTNWRALATSHNIFDLVSIEGQVVMETREAAQDEYVLVSEGQLFSAIIRHPPSISLVPLPPPPMKQIALGSKARITGICIPEDSNPFNNQVPFNILMRSGSDIAVVTNPSWLSVTHLIQVVSGLILVVVLVAIWGAILNRKVRRQTAALSARIALEASLERQNVQLEQQRSRILEEINGSVPLTEVLDEICAMTSIRMGGAACWFEMNGNERAGAAVAANSDLRIVCSEIPSRKGSPLGSFLVGFPAGSGPEAIDSEAISVAVRLATLAIETRRLYSDLLHRSEFDLLTDIHNRFSLDKQLDAYLIEAQLNAGSFGLIYIDLDEFKQVNDIFGHRIGDIYLQDVTRRMERQLRTTDMLARIGGDEFAVLAPLVNSRKDVDEIALRLERCFDDPFAVEGHILRGSASIGIALYPEDATNKDSLFNVADAAMYLSKHAKQSAKLMPLEHKPASYAPGDEV